MPQPTTLLKKRLWHKCFPVNFAKFLSAITEHLLVTASIEKKLLYKDKNIPFLLQYDGIFQRR